MPELSRFLGIVITMFYRDHAPPHFHAFYGDFEIEVSIADGVVTGKLSGVSIFDGLVFTETDGVTLGAEAFPVSVSLSCLGQPTKIFAFRLCFPGLVLPPVVPSRIEAVSRSAAALGQLRLKD